METMMSTNARSRLLALTLVAALAAATGEQALAQASGSTGPLSNMILTGYGGATYGAMLGQGLNNTPNDFSASVSPVLLFSMGDNLLFETELEFGVSGATTTTVLEYAQIDYLGFDKFQFIAGKFLLPFGIFGERLHPTWINKLPNMPQLFGHAHGGVAEGALLPVLSDAGLMTRFIQPFGTSSLNVSLYVTQGPSIVTEEALDGHAHAVVPNEVGAPAGTGSGGTSHYIVPDVGFGISFADNNANKMVGARVGYVRAATLEVYVSGFHAMYDPTNYLDYQGLAVSAQYRRGAFGLLAEGAYLRQEFAAGGTAFETMTRPAYYVEATRRFGAFEPVVRWSQLMDAEVLGTVMKPGSDQLSMGLNYWVMPTVPLKVAYVLNPDLADQLLVQWAFGF